VQERHRRWCGGQLAILAGQARDVAWLDRFDRVAAETRAALVRPNTLVQATAADRVDGAADRLAEQFAELLLLRGRPAESQHRFEQAAEHAANEGERIRLLRLAAGAAAARLVGDDALRLLRAAAAAALAEGDRPTAAECLAWIAIYAQMAPGIIASPLEPDEVQRTLAEAAAHAQDGTAAEAAVATATTAALPDRHADAVAGASRAVELAQRAGSPLIASVALDALCAAHLALGEYGPAIDAIRRRGEILDRLPLDASCAYQLNDFLLMGSEVHLAVGDLARAAEYADRLGELDCYREHVHPALARRVKVDALAGDFDAATERGERFLVAWERAGRHQATTLAASTYAMAMVHGLLGDEGRRQEWVDATRHLLKERPALSLDGCATGWAPTLDAIVALDQDQPEQAVARLSADIDDALWQTWNTALWRPWYAAVWAEAAVLAGSADAAVRLDRAALVTQQNPIAAAILARATDLAHGNLGSGDVHATTFASLGCSYQEFRTRRLFAGGQPVSR
jgi:hypothetical protein